MTLFLILLGVISLSCAAFYLGIQFRHGGSRNRSEQDAEDAAQLEYLRDFERRRRPAEQRPPGADE